MYVCQSMWLYVLELWYQEAAHAGKSLRLMLLLLWCDVKLGAEPCCDNSVHRWISYGANFTAVPLSCDFWTAEWLMDVGVVPFTLNIWLQNRTLERCPLKEHMIFADFFHCIIKPLSNVICVYISSWKRIVARHCRKSRSLFFTERVQVSWLVE